MSAQPISGSSSERQFGQGSGEPYALALRHGHGQLSVLDVQGAVPAVHYRVQDWLMEADDFEQSLLLGLKGSLLDIGCGPGRMLFAAETQGIRAYGIDSSSQAAHRAQSRGAVVFHQSIFATVPGEGGYNSLLLLDGNIGIGGNPANLLQRLFDVAAPGATLFVETDPVMNNVAQYQAVLIDAAGRSSEVFDWARLGADALHRLGAEIGWHLVRCIEQGGRKISVLRR